MGGGLIFFFITLLYEIWVKGREGIRGRQVRTSKGVYFDWGKECWKEYGVGVRRVTKYVPRVCQVRLGGRRAGSQEGKEAQEVQSIKKGYTALDQKLGIEKVKRAHRLLRYSRTVKKSKARLVMVPRVELSVAGKGIQKDRYSRQGGYGSRVMSVFSHLRQFLFSRPPACKGCIFFFNDYFVFLPMLSRTVGISSWKIRGMGDPIKRATVFSELESHGSGLMCLQETYLTNESKILIRNKKFQAQFHSVYLSYSRGVSILVKKGLAFSCRDVKIDALGCYVFLHCFIEGNPFIIANLYIPSPFKMEILYCLLEYVDTGG